MTAKTISIGPDRAEALDLVLGFSRPRRTAGAGWGSRAAAVKRDTARGTLTEAQAHRMRDVLADARFASVDPGIHAHYATRRSDLLRWLDEELG